jgi:hypothetical protein
MDPGRASPPSGIRVRFAAEVAGGNFLPATGVFKMKADATGAECGLEKNRITGRDRSRNDKE